MKFCEDCSQPIKSYYAKRCKKCSAIKRERERIRSVVHCKHCNKEFTIMHGEFRSIMFCSRKCKIEHYQVPCKNCGKMFSHHGKHNAETCSVRCRGELRTRLNPKGDFICDNCGKQFKAYVSQRVKPHTFCSMKCKVEWWKGSNHIGYNSIDCICQICGKEFRREKYKVDKNGGKYCSQQCFSQSQVLPTVDYYGPNWKAQKHKARKRDNYTCQNCSIKQGEYPRALDVHHIIPFREFGLTNHEQANQLSNLVSLCKHCHRRVEKGNVILGI